MKKSLVFGTAWLTLLSTLGAAGCSCGGSAEGEVKLSTTKSEYHAEYGERFLIPDAIVENGKASEVTYEVKDEDGNLVTALGGFYPEIGRYTLTYTLGDKTATATIICADTVGPEISYTAYVRQVYEADEFTVPAFVATDISTVNESSASLKIYKGSTGSEEITATDGKLRAEAGVDAYRFVYSIQDGVGNTGTVTLMTSVKEDYIDASLTTGTMWDFNEAEYINLIGEHTSSTVNFANAEIVTNAPAGANGGALKLTYNESGYAGVKLFHGYTISTAYSTMAKLKMRVYAEQDITLLSVASHRADLAPIEFSDLAAGMWHELDISPRALLPNAFDLDNLEISFRCTEATTLYIDEIYTLTPYVDESLDSANGYIADFDEEGYLNNIEQAGYDIGKGMISGEHEIVSGSNAPDGTNGGALKVVSNEVWSSKDSYGQLGDGVKYYFPESVNTADISKLQLRLYCETGSHLALAFNYTLPSGTTARSKACWVRGKQGEWVTINIGETLIDQIVPYSPVADADGVDLKEFDLTAVTITSCGNVDEDTTTGKVPNSNPCMEFYIDDIKIIKHFNDTNLAEGTLADFNEAGYIASVDQAWPSETNTATYEILAEGNANIPADANGGVVKANFNKTTEVYLSGFAQQADGIRFNLFQPIEYNDLNSLSLRVYSEEGTLLNVGFIIEKADGTRTYSNAWWETATEGAWKTIELNAQRLAVQESTLAGCKIVGVRVWARSSYNNSESTLVFDGDYVKSMYIDEITYTMKSAVPEPEVPTNGILVDWTGASDIGLVSQGPQVWNGQSYGGATYTILNPNTTTPAVSGYQYINDDRLAVLKSKNMNMLEIVSRQGSVDGALITFANAYATPTSGNLVIPVYTMSNNAGYEIHIKDSNGTDVKWRIKSAAGTGVNSAYTIYTWSDINIPASSLSTLTDIKSISISACAESTVSYLYVAPITFGS